MGGLKLLMAYLALLDIFLCVLGLEGGPGAKYANDPVIEENAASLPHCLPEALRILRRGKGSIVRVKASSGKQGMGKQGWLLLLFFFCAVEIKATLLSCTQA